MVNRVRVEFRRGPREHEHVVALARLGLSERAVADFLHWNDVNGYLRVILLAPVPGQHIHKPLIKFGKEVGPLRNLQRLLAGECAIGEKEKRAKGSGG